MASSIVRLQPPEPFNFKAPDLWRRWKRCFLQFRGASGSGEEDNRKQVSALLYCMGESVEDVLASTDISADERKSFDSVITQFDSFVKVWKNVIFERACFNCRSQEEIESTAAFNPCLYQLVKNCEYGDMKDQMLRDRIVVGIRNKASSQRMQLDAKLTLEKAKTLSRQREAIREQQVILGSTTKATQSIDHIHKSHQKGSKRNQFQWSKPSTGRTQPSKTCTRCGRGPHPRHQCVFPTRDTLLPIVVPSQLQK